MKNIRYLLCLSGILWAGLLCMGSNLRVGRPLVTEIDGMKATVCLTVEWDNSWRNMYNYDAVYLFGKYRFRNLQEWETVSFSEDGHTAEESGYTILKAQAGLFLYRAGEGQGHSAVTLRMIWELPSAGFPSALEAGEILFDFQGCEMVYIPCCPFYAGDGVSARGFTSPDFGRLPADCDLIGSNSDFTYTASSGTASSVAGRLNNGAARWSAAVPAWWQVDFKTPKKILYFGVSSSPGINAGPAGDWYLLGGRSEAVFDTLWKGGPEYWSSSSISYPVQKAIRITVPGSYRYYRIFVKDLDVRRKLFWNDIQLLNVAMTEEEAEERQGEGVLVDLPGQQSLGSYPSGYAGFFAMKYGLTQEQYVTFLNKVNCSGQYSRTIGGLLDGLKEGEYVFGESGPAAHRNGIVMLRKGRESGEPFGFGCDLNKGTLPDQPDDGQTIACNYLSPADMLAYADWAGLRPLSELEYEKMAAPPAELRWEKGSYAWGNTTLAYGEGWKDTGQETEALMQGRVVAGKRTDGPLRAGNFLQAGRDRREGGVSFWGVEDLSGNLSEIYYNAEVYGRQLDGKVHGDGKLTEFGKADVPVSAWPDDIRSFGVRGGDYSSVPALLRIADRTHAEGFFRDPDERRPEVGFRLGYTAPVTVVSVEVELENGLTATAGHIAYDTVCEGGTYCLRVHAAEPERNVYTWYRSTDGGNSWVCLEGCQREVLTVKDIAREAEWGNIAVRLYKCCVASPGGAGSAVAGLVAGRGFRVSSLRDTLRPCMESAGFTVTTPLPATFEWKCMDNGNPLTAARETPLSSHYAVAARDFREGEKYPSGKYILSLNITLAGRCRMEQPLEVIAIPATVNPFPLGDETFTYSSDNHRIIRIWGGEDRQAWRLVNHDVGTLRIGPDNGVLTGLAATLCSNVQLEVLCADFPDRVYSQVICERTRNFGYAGRAQQVYLLPGAYQMVCKGAGGGNDGQVGAPGGMASGTLTLHETYPAYVSVGGAGASGASGSGGGWNGGGNAGGSGSSGGGGGGTDFRIGGTAWADRIMVAGGGGGGGNSCGNTTGGNGGGLNGGRNSAGSIATQTSGNAIGQAGHRSGDGGGGGGGYWGGYAASCDGGGGGGSGYVSGFPGCAVHKTGLIFGNPALVEGAGSARCSHGSASITVIRQE